MVAQKNGNFAKRIEQYTDLVKIKDSQEIIEAQELGRGKHAC